MRATIRPFGHDRRRRGTEIGIAQRPGWVPIAISVAKRLAGLEICLRRVGLFDVGGRVEVVPILEAGEAV
jgi:hypothetical protein